MILKKGKTWPWGKRNPYAWVGNREGRRFRNDMTKWKEGDMSQAVPDNGRDGETGYEVLDTCMDVQADKWLKDKNGLMKSG